MTTATSTIKDPICGMPVDAAKAIHVDRSGKTYYFCGAKCRDKFLALPLGKKPVKSGGCCG
jgi:P-type Cu+ transporter